MKRTEQEQRAMDDRFWDTNRRMAEQNPDEARAFAAIYQSLTMVREQLDALMATAAGESQGR